MDFAGVKNIDTCPMGMEIFEDKKSVKWQGL